MFLVSCTAAFVWHRCLQLAIQCYSKHLWVQQPPGIETYLLEAIISDCSGAKYVVFSSLSFPFFFFFVSQCNIKTY